MNAFSFLLIAALLSPSDSEILASVADHDSHLRVEPSIAFRGDDVIVAWNDSFGGTTGSQTGVAAAWSTSRDGGLTFEPAGLASGDPPAGADSRIVVGPDGRFFLMVLAWREGAHSIEILAGTEDDPTGLVPVGTPMETSGKP